MASDGLVLNNRFDRIKGCAISLGAEFSYWREAGWSRNLVVSGNQIRDVARGGTSASPTATPSARSASCAYRRGRGPGFSRQ